MHCSPANESGKNPTAGVGVMWRPADVHIHPERIKDPELQEAHLKGMVGKYTVDVGWETAMSFYNIYGESGGTSANIAVTEALLLACQRDMALSPHGPHAILGDFNATPCKLGPVKDLIAVDQWTDVGQRADWWGGTANEWTCHSRSKAKRSRIDGVVVDAEMLATIHSFEVEKRIHIPTHRVLRFEVARNALKETRTFLRKLGSIRNAVEDKWKELSKDLGSDKEAAKARKEEVSKLKAAMDRNLQSKAEQLDEAMQRRGVEAFWVQWSSCVEEAFSGGTPAFKEGSQ